MPHLVGYGRPRTGRIGMGHRHSWRRRVRYRWDTLLSRGPSVVVLWLGLFSVLLVLVAAFVIRLARIDVDGRRPGLLEGVWLALQRTLDPGTGGGDNGSGFRAVSLAVTIGGIFIVSALIGVIATGLDQKLSDLRKGRSHVVEAGHTIILGWSPKLFTILQELDLANDSRSDACVVLMAQRDKVEMEDEISSRIGRMKSTRLVCRTGNPSDPADILIVDPLTSASIIVLQPDGEVAPDAAVVRSVLALLRLDPQLETLRIVAEFRDQEKATAVSEVTDGKILTVMSAEIIARVTAQVCRQPGLSLVFQDLLDFDGAEIYLVEEERLAGLTFAECVGRYATSTVIGIRRKNGETLLAPPVDSVVETGDRVILIAEDDSTIELVEPCLSLSEKPVVAPTAPAPVPDRMLIVGWNDLGPLILKEL